MQTFTLATNQQTEKQLGSISCIDMCFNWFSTVDKLVVNQAFFVKPLFLVCHDAKSKSCR